MWCVHRRRWSASVGSRVTELRGGRERAQAGAAVVGDVGARSLLQEEAAEDAADVVQEDAASASEVMGEMNTNAAVSGEAEAENEKHEGFARVRGRSGLRGLLSSRSTHADKQVLVQRATVARSAKTYACQHIR
jgi:hypothetical protein